MRVCVPLLWQRFMWVSSRCGDGGVVVSTHTHTQLVEQQAAHIAATAVLLCILLVPHFLSLQQLRSETHLQVLTQAGFEGSVSWGLGACAPSLSMLNPGALTSLALMGWSSNTHARGATVVFLFWGLSCVQQCSATQIREGTCVYRTSSPLQLLLLRSHSITGLRCGCLL